MGEARVRIVILNFNGWRDTLPCLESVLRLDYEAFDVAVCDNGSSDDSVRRIREWAQGHPDPRADRVTVIELDENRGFAAGNNAGIRWALQDASTEFVWLLNNDTLVDRRALAELVARAREVPRLGLCGSTLLDMADPERVQAYGGFTYNRWLGTSRPIGMDERATHPPPPAEEIESRMFGVQGASVLASAEFLREVGLLSERYFLYFEEQDWAVRARRAGFRLGVATGSIVRHREGASTGGTHRHKSRFADYHQLRSRLIFARTHDPVAYPVVVAALLGTSLKRLKRGQAGRIPMIWRLAALSLLGRLEGGT